MSTNKATYDNFKVNRLKIPESQTSLIALQRFGKMQLSSDINSYRNLYEKQLVNLHMSHTQTNSLNSSTWLPELYNS